MRHAFKECAGRRQCKAAAWFALIAFEGLENGIILCDQIICGASSKSLYGEARIGGSLRGKTDPSMTKRLGMSQVRPNLSQTPVSGVALMRAPPTRWA